MYYPGRYRYGPNKKHGSVHHNAPYRAMHSSKHAMGDSPMSHHTKKMPMTLHVMSNFNDTITPCEVDYSNPNWHKELLNETIASHIESHLENNVLTGSECRKNHNSVLPFIKYKLCDSFDSSNQISVEELPKYSLNDIQSRIWKVTRDFYAENQDNVHDAWNNTKTTINQKLYLDPNKLFGVGSHLYDTSLCHHPQVPERMDQWKKNLFEETAGSISAKLSGFSKLSEWKNFKESCVPDPVQLAANMELHASEAMNFGENDTRKLGHFCNMIKGRLVNDPSGFEEINEISDKMSQYIGDSITKWLNDGSARAIPCVRENLIDDLNVDSQQDLLKINEQLSQFEETHNPVEVACSLETDLTRHFSEDGELHERISGLFGKDSKLTKLVDKAKSKLKERRDTNKQIKEETKQERQDLKDAIQRKKEAVKLATKKAELEKRQKKGEDAQRRLDEMKTKTEEAKIMSRMPALMSISAKLPDLKPTEKVPEYSKMPTLKKIPTDSLVEIDFVGSKINSSAKKKYLSTQLPELVTVKPKVNSKLDKNQENLRPLIKLPHVDQKIATNDVVSNFPKLIPISSRLTSESFSDIPDDIKKMPELAPIEEKFNLPPLVPIDTAISKLHVDKHMWSNSHNMHSKESHEVKKSSRKKKNISAKMDMIDLDGSSISAHDLIDAQLVDLEPLTIDCNVTNSRRKSKSKKELLMCDKLNFVNCHIDHSDKTQEEEKNEEEEESQSDMERNTIDCHVSKKKVRFEDKKREKVDSRIGSSISKTVKSMVTITDDASLNSFVKQNMCVPAFGFIQTLKTAKMNVNSKVGQNSNMVDVYCCPNKQSFMSSTLNLTKVNPEVYKKHENLYSGQILQSDLDKLKSGGSNTLMTTNGKMTIDLTNQTLNTTDIKKTIFNVVHYNAPNVNEVYIFTN